MRDILLDVLFEENHYERLIEKEIANELLISEGKNLTVSLPSVDCMLGCRFISTIKN